MNNNEQKVEEFLSELSKLMHEYGYDLRPSNIGPSIIVWDANSESFLGWVQPYDDPKVAGEFEFTHAIVTENNYE